MKIVSVDVYSIDIKKRYPIVVPIGILDRSRNVLVKISTDEGIEGWGEASPFAVITGDSQESNFRNAEIFGRLLLDRDPVPVEVRMAEINAVTAGECSLKSAFDVALYDIAARVAGLPLFRYLGGEAREMHTDYTVGLQDSVATTLRRVEECFDTGFNEVKLKVGRPGLRDVDHVTAVRELVGEEASIKLDSNQGWDYPTAVANLRAMESSRPQYSEQPLPAWDWLNLSRLRECVNVPICADESLFDDRDAMKLIRAEAVDYLNIKLGKSGGIGTALRIEAIARSAGKTCMIGCFGETRLGLTAAAHLATARPNIQFIDLDSAFDLESDPVQGGIQYELSDSGRIDLPEEPGLGVSVDPSFLRKCHHYRIGD